MGRTLSDEDIDAIATQVVQVIATRLAHEKPPAPPPPRPSEPELKIVRPRLAYSLAELSAELGMSKVSIYRLEARGLLRSLPYLRTKTYSHAEVERFLRGQGGEELRRKG